MAEGVEELKVSRGVTSVWVLLLEVVVQSNITVSKITRLKWAYCWSSYHSNQFK